MVSLFEKDRISINEEEESTGSEEGGSFEGSEIEGGKLGRETEEEVRVFGEQGGKGWGRGRKLLKHL